MTTTLSDRRSRILSFIVEDYVASAQPVGSKALVSNHELDLSSATVRNEMAALEDAGMVTHPHTSAGRIPSDAGYRYYVTSLMTERELTRQEQFTILHQFHQSARELENWLGLATSVLAQSVHSLALATQPHQDQVRLKQIQLVSLTDERALLVVVTNDAAVHQHTIEFENVIDQSQLSQLADQINRRLSGKGAADFPTPPDEGRYADIQAIIERAVSSMLLTEATQSRDAPIVEGVRDLLRKPEYEDIDRMLDTIEAVDAKHLHAAIPAEEMSTSDVMVVIGDENEDGPYRSMSFVLTRYGPSNGTGGTIGVLGPTRMDYSDTVAHVRYVSEVLTELMQGFYGESD